MLDFVKTFLTASFLCLLTLAFLTYNGYGFSRLFLTYRANEKYRLLVKNLGLERWQWLWMPLIGLIYLSVVGSTLMIFVAPMQISAWLLLAGVTFINGGVIWRERGLALSLKNLRLKSLIPPSLILLLILGINLTPMASRRYLTITSPNIDNLNQYLPVTQQVIIEKLGPEYLITQNRGLYAVYASMSLFTGLDIYQLITAIVTAWLVLCIAAAFLFFVTILRQSERLAWIGALWLVFNSALSWLVFFGYDQRPAGIASLAFGLMALTLALQYPQIRRFQLLAVVAGAAVNSIYLPTTLNLALVAAALFGWWLLARPNRLATLSFGLIYLLGIGLLSLPHTLSYLLYSDRWIKWLADRTLSAAFTPEFFFNWGDGQGLGAFVESWHHNAQVRPWYTDAIPPILTTQVQGQSQIISTTGAFVLAFLVSLGCWRLAQNPARRYLLSVVISVFFYFIWMRYILNYTYGFFATLGYNSFLVVGLATEGLAFINRLKRVTYRAVIIGWAARIGAVFIAGLLLAGTFISVFQNVSDSQRIFYPRDLSNFAELPAHIAPGTSLQFSEYYIFNMGHYALTQRSLKCTQQCGPNNSFYMQDGGYNHDVPPNKDPASFAADYLVLRDAETPGEAIHKLYNLLYRTKDPNWHNELVIYRRAEGLAARRLLERTEQKQTLRPGQAITIQANESGLYIPSLGEKPRTASSQKQTYQLSALVFASQAARINLKISNQTGPGQFYELQPGYNIIRSASFDQTEQISLEGVGLGEAEIRELGLWYS